MVQMWGSTNNYPTSESAFIVSNKRVRGVNQKVAPGLSATLNMKLKQKHSGVKMGLGFIPVVLSVATYPICCFDTAADCPGYDKSKCP